LEKQVVEVRKVRTISLTLKHRDGFVGKVPYDTPHILLHDACEMFQNSSHVSHLLS